MKRVNTIEMTSEEAKVLTNLMNLLSEEEFFGEDFSEVLYDIRRAFTEENSEVTTVNDILIVIN